MLLIIIDKCKINMKDQLEQECLKASIPSSTSNNEKPEQKHIENVRFFQPTKTISPKCLIYIIIIIIIVALNYLFIKVNWMNHMNKVPIRNQIRATQPSITKINNLPDSAPVTRFKKIFWIYTENQLETEGMYQLVYLHHFNDTAHKFGYTVRFANSWNSYDWLSEQTIAKISKAMQNNKVDEPVHNLLKIALLMENGGILVSQFDIVFRGQNFKWIEDMFEPQKQSNDPQHLCQPEKSYLYMINRPDQFFTKKYDSFFIAAVPNSDILKESFQTLINFIQTGTFPHGSELNIVQKNLDTNVSYAINSLDDSINHVLYQYLNRNETGTEKKSLCEKYGIQQRKTPNTINMFEFNEAQKLQILKTGNLDEFFRTRRDLYHIRIVRGTNNGPVIWYLNSIIENHVEKANKMVDPYQPNSIMSDLLNAPGNKQIFHDSYSEREVQLCLVVMDTLDRAGIAEAANTFSSQELKKWKQVLFAKDINDIPKIIDERIVVVQSRFNEVRNIEIAATKHCHLKGYVVLLHENEKFNHNKALNQIAQKVQPRDTLGAFISLQKDSKLIEAVQHSRFYRRQDAMVNPNFPLMESILNHFRVFSIQSFRYIPQLDLRDIHGNYLTDRMIFLMTLLQMIKTQIHEPHFLYLMKKYSELWNVPRKTALLGTNTLIITSKKDEVDRQQLVKTKTRLQCQDVHQTIYEMLRFKIPFTKMLAFNNGDQFVPADKKQGPEIIPKLIHQVWLGTDDLPPAKQYFYRKTQNMYPNFQIKLWREQNITKQNFPLTYDVIKTIINFNKHSPYNKLATVADIMRHQILYHEGGFWKDAGVNFLRPILNQFTRYKLVIAVDKTFRYRWLQGMCFFANIPKFQNMFRITNYRNINRMRIYNNYASYIAGPIDFRQLLIGQQEYDPQFLTMPYETIYPAQIYEHPQKDLCMKRLQELNQGDKFQVVQNGWYLMSNCDKLYPYAYGVEHNRYGDTWGKRRTTKK